MTLNSLRHFFALSRKQEVVDDIKSLLSAIKRHGFKCVAVEPRVKDGGVFVRFRYTANRLDGDETQRRSMEGEDTTSKKEKVLQEILEDVKNADKANGGMPTWIGQSHANVWVVKGVPWREVRISCIYAFTTLIVSVIIRISIALLPLCLKYLSKVPIYETSTYTPNYECVSIHLLAYNLFIISI